MSVVLLWVLKSADVIGCTRNVLWCSADIVGGGSCVTSPKNVSIGGYSNPGFSIKFEVDSQFEKSKRQY